MQPLTMHHAITIQNCIARGGHFFCSETLEALLWGIYHGVVKGPAITNTAHSRVTTYLRRLMAFWQNNLTKYDWPYRGK